MGQVESQRDDLATLYHISDELSRSVQPDVGRQRAVELVTNIFGSECLLVAGHFHPQSRAFHGTVTYRRNNMNIVERPYPDDAVREAAPYFDPGLVDQDRGIEVPDAARLLYQLGIAEVEADPEPRRVIEQDPARYQRALSAPEWHERPTTLWPLSSGEYIEPPLADVDVIAIDMIADALKNPGPGYQSLKLRKKPWQPNLKSLNLNFS